MNVRRQPLSLQRPRDHGVVFDCGSQGVLNATVIVTVDEKHCVALPQPAKPGDTFDVELSGPTGFVLTRVEPSLQPVRLQRKDGYLVAVTPCSITQAVTRRALDEFP